MNIKLNYKKIVDKKFEPVINGYSPTQVDMFLDKICIDYMEYNKIIEELTLELTKAKKEFKAFKDFIIDKDKKINEAINLSKIKNDK